MKALFISNFFNHHQKYISDAMDTLCASYHFIETEPVPEERRRMGYRADYHESYLLSAGCDEAKRAISDADVIIIGSAPYSLIRDISRERLIFSYSERPLKQGFHLYKYPYRYLKWKKQFSPIKRHYLLSCGAFAPGDYAKYGLFRNKAYKWGYFPQTLRYDIDALCKKKDRAELLWCGRFLDWKHPDDAVTAAYMLRDSGCCFHLTMIGSGEMEATLRAMIAEYHLEQHITLTGTMEPDEVRKRMENAGIFLFTSDRQEGWGAVLNEAMNSACAAVASHAIGSVPYLTKNNENAVIYRSSDIDALYRKLRYLLDYPEEQERLGRAAYDTIISEWNAETAASRLVKIVERMLSGDSSPDLFSSGPCSKAEIMKDNWLKEE